MLYELSYILLITPLIFPHQQVYGFLLILPATAYILLNVFLEVKTKTKVSLRLVLFVIAIIITNSITLFGFMREELFHFKITTYGVLLQLGLFLSYSFEDLPIDLNNKIRYDDFSRKNVE